MNDDLQATTSKGVTNLNDLVPNDSCQIDFELSKIASHLGKTDALRLYWEGAAVEATGDVNSAISLYKRAYRMWPALDSITYGGLPLMVRQEAEKAGLSCQLAVVDVPMSRASKVIHSPGLLTQSDFEAVDSILHDITSVETSRCNNSQNTTHQHKVCTFLNNPPHHRIVRQAPEVTNKLLNFGLRAWEEANWSGDIDNPGPLFDIKEGLSSLSIRVVEHWEYSIGGGLTDPLHYDVDSVITIVALLSEADDFDGGIFRTNEPNDVMLEHNMNKGDVICFISHKFHNIVPLTRGKRRSLVLELWQGGVGHEGRGD
jgi:hypothetical protein